MSANQFSDDERRALERAARKGAVYAAIAPLEGPRYCAHAPCGKRAGRGRYCSRRCKEAARKARRAAEHPVRCRHCGDPVTTAELQQSGRPRLYHEACAWAVQRKQAAEHQMRKECNSGLDLRIGLIDEHITSRISGAYRDALRRDPCAYCGGAGGVLDHIEPIGGSGRKRSKRGDLPNLTGACRECNAAKLTTPLLHALIVLAVRRKMLPLGDALAAWAGRRYMLWSAR